jgi:hypothetical protein
MDVSNIDRGIFVRSLLKADVGSFDVDDCGIETIIIGLLKFNQDCNSFNWEKKVGEKPKLNLAESEI